MMLLTTSILTTWLAVVPEPTIAPHAHAEIGAVVREPSLDQPGIDVAVPPAMAAGVGVGLVIGRPEARSHAWLDGGVISSVGARAIETLGDGSSRTRPARSQVVRASFGVVLAAREHVQVGFGLGYALRAFTSPVDERIAAQLSHVPQLVMPLVFTSRRGRVALRLRPGVGLSLPAVALSQRSEPDIGLAVGVAVELDVRLIGPLVLRLAAREDQDLFAHLHDAQHLATLALVFDANTWIRPRP